MDKNTAAALREWISDHRKFNEPGDGSDINRECIRAGYRFALDDLTTWLAYQEGLNGL